MTEREILKRFIKAWDENDGMARCIADAKDVLAQNGEHPAVEAYWKWFDSLPSRQVGLSEGYLAGWKQALQWASEQPYFALSCGGNGESALRAYAVETPTHLP